ncbi:hypothetical protein LTR84_003731 [Exophiala bonariae]|uniref:SNF2 N-terminal domain-containing protein n=1 Tax=Exophiala bonariae TaxID=1690606 RepID=A0AAV9N9I5_9EURO|nr:hypothetical protein LTR84_003731 [Exophiala bonariae]
MSEKQATKVRTVPDWQCPFLLHEMFNVAWVDEVHEIKRDDGSQALSLEWLRAEFTGLASASPGINGIEDFRKYLKVMLVREESTAEERAQASVDEPRLNLFTIGYRCNHLYL